MFFPPAPPCVSFLPSSTHQRSFVRFTFPEKTGAWILIAPVNDTPLTFSHIPCRFCAPCEREGGGAEFCCTTVSIEHSRHGLGCSNNPGTSLVLHMSWAALFPSPLRSVTERCANEAIRLVGRFARPGVGGVGWSGSKKPPHLAGRCGQVGAMCSINMLRLKSVYGEVVRW